jgi:hypothetical protein
MGASVLEGPAASVLMVEETVSQTRAHIPEYYSFNTSLCELEISI